jgi:hypothetical protein
VDHHPAKRKNSQGQEFILPLFSYFFLRYLLAFFTNREDFISYSAKAGGRPTASKDRFKHILLFSKSL